MDPVTMMQMALMAYQAYQSSQNASSANATASTNAQLSRSAQQQAREASRASRTDPYGNKLYYSGGQWRYKLTPLTQGTLSAEQGEMLKNLTEDARRNRDYRARMEGFSKQAGQDYENVRNEYRFGDKPNEGNIIDDITRQILLSRKQGVQDTEGLLAKQALRMNNSGVIPSIMRAGDTQLGGGLEESILKGRNLGRQEFQSEQTARDSHLQNWLNNFMQVARGQPQANISKSGLYGDLSSNMATALSGTSGGGGLSASASAGTPQNTMPDLSGLSGLIGKLKTSSVPSEDPGTGMWQDANGVWHDAIAPTSQGSYSF